MGISGLLRHLGPGERISLAKFSSQHYTTHNRPLRLAIDISIWLFQIQSGKGGSNPALRTFYYRLLRLLSLSVHPLFVFDGPNKPLFKRNKKVGGPGVKVATVPEFLAKQLLKQFGFPWHVAPGEAEAECALLQRQSVVDAVLSEDVDTLMFGSGVTLRNWSQEGTAKGNKTPTHVNVYRAHETKERSNGIDKEGMILVALMSGGDYIPEGVPGVGPKVACDAARAGFGKELCTLHRKDAAGLKAWKERLENEIRTNASKFFSRKNTGFVMPGDFPSREVLGYYTHPCVSTPEKVERLRREVKWDLNIDFTALRGFTGDAFDWRCRGGAKKFIKNLAPALLIRELRLEGESAPSTQPDQEAQMINEGAMVHAIHGKRNHATTDRELEYRISFTPSTLVPIDLSLEEEDDDFTPAGGVEDESEAESEAFPSTQAEVEDNESAAPGSPTKKRQFRPYYPDQPEKLWILRPFLRAGCPLLVEDYEACTQDPREFLRQRQKARAVNKKDANIHAPKRAGKKKAAEKEAMPENALMAYARITKAGATRPDKDNNLSVGDNSRTMKPLSPRANVRSNAAPSKTKEKSSLDDEELAAVAAFKLPSTQIPAALFQESNAAHGGKQIEVLDLAVSSPVRPTSKLPNGIDPLRPFAAFRATQPLASTSSSAQRTPKRTSKKRPSPELSSPALSQMTIMSYYSPSPRKQARERPLSRQDSELVDLVSSSPALFPSVDEDFERPLTPTPEAIRQTLRRLASPTPRQRLASREETIQLLETVTKRRRKGPLKRWQTDPVGFGIDGQTDRDSSDTRERRALTPEVRQHADETIVISSSPDQSDEELASPSAFNPSASHSGSQVGVVPQNDLESRRSQLVRHVTARGRESDFANEGGFIREDAGAAFSTHPGEPPSPSYPAPMSNSGPPADDLPRFQMPPQSVAPPSKRSALLKLHRPKAESTTHEALKNVITRIRLRESLEGAWKEVQVDADSTEMLDMTGNGSGWKRSGGKAEIWTGWRKSGVEVLDLTGA